MENNLLEIFIGILMLYAGVMAVISKKLFNSVLYLSLLSMVAVVGFVFMKAPDVAITEAVIGSGLVTAVFLLTIAIEKRSGDIAWKKY